MALPQVVRTLTEKRNGIAELRRPFTAAARELSSVTAVLGLHWGSIGGLHKLSPTTQTRFPASAHLNQLFAYGEMFNLNRFREGGHRLPEENLRPCKDLSG